jgi:threonine dehydrogenase-like Zn-dependent dehydrogenase
MRAVQISRPEQVDVIDVPRPSAGEGEVLVSMERLSICGSDMRYYRSPNPDDFPMPPAYPFHECAGTVVESREKKFDVGDRVIVLTPDRKGGADYVAARPERLVKVPGDRDLSIWLMAQPLGTVLYPCQSLNVLGRSVVVLGQGPIGLTFTQILAGMRPLELIAVDVLDYRLEVARELGATVVVNSARDDIRDVVRSLTHGTGADVVIESAGRVETINAALDAVRFRGTVSSFGQPVTDPISFNYKVFSRKEINLFPTITHARPDLTEGVALGVELIAKGIIDPAWMVTHRLPFEDVAKAFEIYATQADNSLKVVIDV